MNKNIDLTLTCLISMIILILVTLACLVTDYHEQDEQIKQLKQSNVEIQQECEVYRNRSQEYEDRCLELENIIEGCGLVVDNCECR